MYKFSFLLLLLGLFSFSACHKDEDDHDDEASGPIAIAFLSPSANAVLSSDTASISLSFTAAETLHDIEVGLYVDSSNAVVAPFPLDVHSHNASVTVSETVDLSGYPSGTRFRLEAQACRDHDCAEIDRDTLYFSIQ